MKKLKSEFTLLLIFFYIFNKISSMVFINNSQGECMALVNYFGNFYLLNLYSRQCFTLGSTLLLATTIPYPKATQHFLGQPEAMPLNRSGQSSRALSNGLISFVFDLLQQLDL